MREIKMEYETQTTSGRYRCQQCEYTSDRQYNVIRHEGRIHSRKVDRLCCGKTFLTKGEWYLHCEQLHPRLRTSSLISRQKYKILKHSKKPVDISIRNERQIQRRRSSRIRTLLQKERSMTFRQLNASIDGLQMEDVPLIHFIQYRELREKFIEELCDTYDENHFPTPTSVNDSSEICDGCSGNFSLLTTNKDGNDTSDQVLYHREIVEIATETVRYMNCTNESEIRNDYIEHNAVENHLMTNLTLTSTMKTTNKSKTMETPLNLPLKKRILRELCIDSIEINRCQRTEAHLLDENKNFDWDNKENIQPISMNCTGTFNISKKVIVTRAEESITWNEITKHQRAYLSSVDWDRYKIFPC